MIRRPPRSTLFPLHDALPISHAPQRNSTTEDRSRKSEQRRDRERHRDTDSALQREDEHRAAGERHGEKRHLHRDRKSTRLNSSHSQISYAVFCLKKKTEEMTF